MAPKDLRAIIEAPKQQQTKPQQPKQQHPKQQQHEPQLTENKEARTPQPTENKEARKLERKLRDIEQLERRLSAVLAERFEPQRERERESEREQPSDMV